MRLLLLFFWLFATTFAQEEESQQCIVTEEGETVCLENDGETIVRQCDDQDERCSFWAGSGECDKNPNYMLLYCRKSCDACDLNNNPVDINDWGEPQEMGKDDDNITKKIIQETREYMIDQVFVEDRFRKVRNECRNRHSMCSYWASIGECEKNPKYMQLQCSPACKTCDLIDFDVRCPFDPETAETTNVWSGGDLDEMFANLTTKYRELYSPNIISENPWVVTLDDFISEEECERLIDLGAKRGYERSSDVGEKRFDGTFAPYQNDRRTSTNAWCIEECYEDDVTQTVLKRIEDTIGIPDQNSEYLQLLRYEPSQFYGEHHDYIPHHIDRAEGVRILTVFLYLNDVEAGGGTNFPTLNITVMPKRGRVLIWPSVMDKDPNKKDPRTQHQALPVEAGIKYGANAWVHQRDFKTPYKKGCI